MTYKLTPEHAKLWLPVVRELRGYYERKRKQAFYFNVLNIIPSGYLCSVAMTIQKNPFKACDYCLWKIFEGNKCPTFLPSIWDIIPSSVCKELIENHISRLKRWERRLEEIIRGRSE